MLFYWRLLVTLLTLFLTVRPNFAASGETVPPAPGPAPAAFHSVVGEPAVYRAKRADTLLSIARRHGWDAATLARLNDLKETKAAPEGRDLELPSVYMVPPVPPSEDAVVLNIPERAVYVFRDGRLNARFPVAIGKASWKTPTGRFKIIETIKDPIWETPREMVRRERARRRAIGPGPDNPLGGYWMGWHEIPGTGSMVGFHATNALGSVGTAASHGCVRLYPEHASRLFALVHPGMPVTSIYQPVQIGSRGGRFYLSVWPDVYRTGRVSEERVQETLRQAGLWAVADREAVRRAIERQDGYPELIVGGEERLEVNGRIVSARVAPIQVAGEWLVPVRELVEALGGQVKPLPDWIIEITGPLGGLTLTVDRSPRVHDRGGAMLPLAPMVIDGALMAPLSQLALPFRFEVTHERGRALTLRSETAPDAVRADQTEETVESTSPPLPLP